MRSALESLAGWVPYRAALWFLAWYPIVFALMSLAGSRQWHLDRRGIVAQRLEPDAGSLARAREGWPVVSVVVPARDEEERLGRCLARIAELRWPRLEVLVVDDGSGDATAEVASRWAGREGWTVVSHLEPRGKAACLNEALGLVTGEVVLVVDADVEVVADTLELLVAQLWHHGDLGAVTANVRMLRCEQLLEKLQAVEFCATVGTQRRAHAAWGRVSTMTGACTLLRRAAVEEVGGWDESSPAEDIELTWRLQCGRWRVGYEPRAVAGTWPARGMRQWHRQRRRWAAGLVLAVVHHGRAAARRPAMWPLLVEAAGAVVWSHLVLAATALWAVSVAVGVPPLGNSPVPLAWGTLAVAVAVAQLWWGLWLDRDSDPFTTRLAPYVVWYPLVYWWLSASAVVVATVPALAGRWGTRVRWRPERHG